MSFNLGLNLLSDDQLLELLNECLFEFAQRDGYLRNLAQNTIYKQAEALVEVREWYEALINEEKSRQRAAIKQETIEYFKNWVKGRSLIGPEEEPQLIEEGIVEGVKEAAVEALMDVRVPILQRLSAAFCFNAPLYIEVKKISYGLEPAGVRVVYPGTGHVLISMRETKSQAAYNPTTGTITEKIQLFPCEFDGNSLKHSAPQSVLYILLTEYYNMRDTGSAVILSVNFEPVAPAPPPPPIRAPVTLPNNPGMVCHICQRQMVLICTRCNGKSYCPRCDYCFYCRYSISGRKEPNA